MMNFLEASHFKIASVLAKLECQPKLEHKFGKYIETQRDKQVTIIQVYTPSPTVESSLFVGNQCSKLWWVNLAYEFTSPQTYTQSFVYYLLELS